MRGPKLLAPMRTIEQAVYQPLDVGWPVVHPLADMTDAHTTYPTQFDAFELDGAGNLVAPGTVRDAYGPTNPTISASYPVDPGTGEKYSPLFVTHRAMWIDIGLDDEYEVELAWEVEVPEGAVVQVSPMIAVDLGAADDETALLPAWDISVYGGITYWHVCPMTPDVATCFDPSYYYAIPDTAGVLPVPGVGRHVWSIRASGGVLTSWFDGQRRASFTRPAWSAGRTKVGVHVVGIHVDPDEVFPAGLPWSGQPGIVPPPDATVSAWHWNAL